MDKNKILDAASKLVAKGSYDKAIREYQKVLDADPKDVRILHKLGELYEKKNDNVQAAAFFSRVADSYAADGFSMKAIALYKKILKLDPNLIEVNVKLAELHQQHQLMSEAMGYYQAVANHYDSRGDMRASLDILKRMVELEPDNVASRIKLADLYAREGLQAEAIEEYRRASEHLRRNGRIDDYLRVAERLAALVPDDVNLARDLAQEYLGRGDQKRALAKLQVCFKADPKDVQTLTLLAQAFGGLGQTSKTLSVHKELARIHQDAGRSDEASRVWAKVAQLDPNDPDLQARNAANAKPAAPAPAIVPPPAPAPAPASSQNRGPAPRAAAAAAAGPAASGATGAASGSSNGLSREQLSKLLTETDVYVKYGLHDKALEHLRRVFGVDPENLDAHEKAYQIYVAAGNQAAASEQMLNVLRLCTRRQDVARAQPYLATILHENPHHPEVPAFLSVLRSADTVLPSEASGEEGIPEDAILVDSSDDEIFVADAPEEALVHDDLALAHAASEESVDDVIDEPALAEDDEPLGAYGDDEPLGYEPASAEIVVDEPVFEQMPLDGEPDAYEPPTQEAYVAPSLGDAEVHDAPTRAHVRSPKLAAMAREAEAAAAAAAIAASAEVVAEEQPDESSFDEAPVMYELGDDDPALLSTGAYAALVESGEAAEAEAAAPVTADGWPMEAQPEQSFDHVPWEDAGRLPEGEEVPSGFDAGSYQAEAGGYEAEAGYESEAAVEAPPEEEPAAEECDEASFFLEQGLIEEAREIIETVQIAFPGHVRAAELQARLEALESGGGEAGGDAGGEGGFGHDAPASSDGFDLASELEGELGGFVEEAPMPVSTVDDYQVSVEEVFSEFKRGIEKIVKPEDVETHYDLGIAYKEMGLLEDAIGEFKVARQGCMGKRKEVDCLTMIGLLQMMKGDAPSAVDTFKQALNSGGHVSAETARSLRCELATAWESAGYPGRALYHLQVVAAEVPDFRGVAQNIQRLAQFAAPEPDEEPSYEAGAMRADDPGNVAAAGARSGKVGYI